MKHQAIKHVSALAVVLLTAIASAVVCVLISRNITLGLSPRRQLLVVGLTCTIAFIIPTLLIGRRLSAINNVSMMLLPGERRISDRDLVPLLLYAACGGIATGGILAIGTMFE